MKHFCAILVLMALSVVASAQIDTRIVDSLQEAYATQEGRDKVLTMIELTWDFYDVSFDDCIDWGEKAVKEANALGYKDLEARANYVLGIQYGYHSDLDLAREYLQKSYNQYNAISDTKNAFESLWHLATYELSLGSIDTAYVVYEKALPLAEELCDTLACAYIVYNEGLIEYRKGCFEKAYQCFERSKRIFEALGDKYMSMHVEYNMATINFERGRAFEARDLFWNIISASLEVEDYYLLSIVSLNMGRIYEHEIVDFDSSLYYLNNAISHAEQSIELNERILQSSFAKAEALVEIGNVFYNEGKYELALKEFHEALAFADDVSCMTAQMNACLGLGTVYAHFGKASQSLSYMNRFFELESKTGNSVMHMKARLFLALNYGRLGKFKELEDELHDFEEDYQSLARENADLYDQLRTLRQEGIELQEQYESQNLELQKYQSKAENYRLAFYGLLAIVLSACVLFLLYKIVCKNRVKMEKG